MVVVNLDAAGSHCSYCRGSAVELDLSTWSWVYTFIAKASQRDKPHLSRVACSESFVWRQFDCRLFSNVRSHQRIFQSLWKPAFPEYYEARTIGRVLPMEMSIFRNRVIRCVYCFSTLFYFESEIDEQKVAGFYRHCPSSSSRAIELGPYVRLRGLPTSCL